MEVEFTLWYLYCFLLLAKIAGFQISLFYATVTGQASVTICDFFGFCHLDGLGSGGGAVLGAPWNVGAHGKSLPHGRF